MYHFNIPRRKPQFMPTQSSFGISTKRCYPRNRHQKESSPDNEYSYDSNDTEANSARKQQIIDRRTPSATVKDAADEESSASDGTEDSDDLAASATVEDTAEKSFEDSDSSNIAGSDSSNEDSATAEDTADESPEDPAPKIVGSDGSNEDSDSGAEQRDLVNAFKSIIDRFERRKEKAKVLPQALTDQSNGTTRPLAKSNDPKERKKFKRLIDGDWVNGAKLLEDISWDVRNDPESLDEEDLSNELFEKELFKKDERIILLLENRSGKRRFRKPVNGNRTKNVLAAIHRFYTKYINTRVIDNTHEGHDKEEDEHEGFYAIDDRALFMGIKYESQGEWLVLLE